jgi:hypothetical protein
MWSIVPGGESAAGVARKASGSCAGNGGVSIFQTRGEVDAEKLDNFFSGESVPWSDFRCLHVAK